MNDEQADTSEVRTFSASDRQPAIGILGHVGDRNLGDEAIIEAFVGRMRREWPGLETRIYSMHPSDSARRYCCEAYSIRQEHENEKEFRPPAVFAGSVADSSAPVEAVGQRGNESPPLLERLAGLVPKGKLRSTAGSFVRKGVAAVREIGFLWRSMRRTRGLDVMYVTGSNQFLDNFGGAWGFPYTLLKWTVMCRLVGCRVAFVSMGAGPLDGSLSKWMIGRAIAMADYVSFRDEGSRALIHRACGHDGPVVPDLAHSLNISYTADPPVANEPSTRQLRIAINTMPVHDPRFWHAPDPDLYSAYVQTMGHTARVLLEEGHHVSFFATQFPDASVARDAIGVAIEGEAARGLAVDVPTTVQELMGVLQRADVVIATRFHGILLALLAGRPTVGICYYRKSRELLNEAGMSDYAFDIDAFDRPGLLQAVHGRIEDRLNASHRIERKTLLYRAALEAQYQTLIRHLNQTIGMG
jgi:polysaccharide pyruvyl transferase WcaK-like protein